MVDPRSGLDVHGDWSPAFPGQRPPFAPGNELAAEAPVTHGAYAEGRLLEVAEAEYAALRATFTPWEDAFEMPARQLARIQARTVLAYRWLDEHDLVDGEDEVRAILRELPRWEREATRLFREMALTTRSRIELDLDRLARERGMIELAEAQEAMSQVFEIAGRHVPAESKPAFLRDVRAWAKRATDDDDAIEGSARRLESGPDEEGLGGA